MTKIARGAEYALNMHFLYRLTVFIVVAFIVMGRNLSDILDATTQLSLKPPSHRPVYPIPHAHLAPRS